MGFMANFKGRRAYSTHIRGNQAIDKGDIAKAAELHRQALKLYSEAYEAGCHDVNVVMAYGVLLMRFGEYEKARDLLLSCEHMPGLDAKSKKQLRINYSVCQWRLGNLDRAIELMEEAASNGKTAMIYTTLGYYYIERGIQTGDFAQAIAFNQEAYEYDEEDAGVLDNLGQLYYAMGETDNAVLHRQDEPRKGRRRKGPRLHQKVSGRQLLRALLHLPRTGAGAGRRERLKTASSTA